MFGLLYLAFIVAMIVADFGYADWRDIRTSLSDRPSPVFNLSQPDHLHDFRHPVDVGWYPDGLRIGAFGAERDRNSAGAKTFTSPTRDGNSILRRHVAGHSHCIAAAGGRYQSPGPVSNASWPLA